MYYEDYIIHVYYVNFKDSYPTAAVIMNKNMHLDPFCFFTQIHHSQLTTYINVGVRLLRSLFPTNEIGRRNIFSLLLQSGCLNGKVKFLNLIHFVFNIK